MLFSPFFCSAKIVSAAGFFVEHHKHLFQQKKPYFRALRSDL
jgi:hypothetical protein